MIVPSNNTINIYTNESWVCDHRIKRVIFHYMTLRVGDQQQMVYQATDHGPFLMMNDEDLRLNIFLFFFGGSAVLLYDIFISLANYICLYTSSSLFLRRLCLKLNQIVGSGYKIVSTDLIQSIW